MAINKIFRISSLNFINAKNLHINYFMQNNNLGCKIEMLYITGMQKMDRAYIHYHVLKVTARNFHWAEEIILYFDGKERLKSA